MIKYEFARLSFSMQAENWIIKIYTPDGVSAKELSWSDNSIIIDLLNQGWEPINVTARDEYGFKRVYIEKETNLLGDANA